MEIYKDRIVYIDILRTMSIITIIPIHTLIKGDVVSE